MRAIPKQEIIGRLREAGFEPTGAAVLVHGAPAMVWDKGFESGEVLTVLLGRIGGLMDTNGFRQSLATVLEWAGAAPEAEDPAPPRREEQAELTLVSDEEGVA